MNRIALACVVGLFVLLPACAAPREEDTVNPEAIYDSKAEAWNNPSVRPWREYPFVEKPEWTLHDRLWRDFDNLPSWARRGGAVYAYNSFVRRMSGEQLKAAGYNFVHIHSADIERIRDIRDAGLPFILRIDGQFFYGRRYMDNLA